MLEAKPTEIKIEARVKVVFNRSFSWEEPIGDVEDHLADTARNKLPENGSGKWIYKGYHTDTGHPRAYWVIFRYTD